VIGVLVDILDPGKDSCAAMGEYLDVVLPSVVHHDLLIGAHSIRAHRFQHVVKVAPNLSGLACELFHIVYANADSLFICLFRILKIIYEFLV